MGCRHFIALRSVFIARACGLSGLEILARSLKALQYPPWIRQTILWR